MNLMYQKVVALLRRGIELPENAPISQSDNPPFDALVSRVPQAALVFCLEALRPLRSVIHTGIIGVKPFLVGTEAEKIVLELENRFLSDHTLSECINQLEKRAHG